MSGIVSSQDESGSNRPDSVAPTFGRKVTHSLPRRNETEKPPFVRQFWDRHGKLRRYFRRPGCESTPLPATVGFDSPEFLEAYQAALEGKTAPKREIGAGRALLGTGTVNDAVKGLYLDKKLWGVLSPVTQELYKYHLDFFCEECGTYRIKGDVPSRVEIRLAGVPG